MTPLFFIIVYFFRRNNFETDGIAHNMGELLREGVMGEGELPHLYNHNMTYYNTEKIDKFLI